MRARALLTELAVALGLLLLVVGCTTTKARVGAARASSPTTTTTSAAVTALPDQADPATVGDAIASREPALEACYADGRSRVPDLRGTVTVMFRIAPDGNVSWAREAKAGAFPDRDVAACVVAQFKGLSFPPARGETMVVYPVLLEPKT